MESKLLNIRDLQIHYVTQDGTIKACDGVYLSISEGETVGLVGETGAGKTTTALGIMRLVPDPPGKIIGGEIIFKGQNLLHLNSSQMRKIRGNQISMIFQDPMTSLNPVIPIGEQIAEVVRLHQKVSRSEAEKRAKEMLEIVGIQPERINDFPHQFSGGMKQRVVIAVSLSCNPALLIADEPTTALDVTIQAQVLEVMKALRDRFKTSMLLITHDLGIVAEVCDRVAIMYAGQIVEYTDKRTLFTTPKHPYTVGLFGSIPNLKEDQERLSPIKGILPDPTDLPPGCVFHTRCPDTKEICMRVRPQETEVGSNHKVRCLKYESQYSIHFK